MSDDEPIESIPARVLWDAAPDGLVLVDDGGRIAATNLAAEEMFGYTANELAGEPVEILVPEEAAERHVGDRQRYAQAPVSRPMGLRRDLAGRRRDGSRFPVHISLAPVATNGHRFTVAAVRDMTQRAEIEAEAAEANRRRSIAEDHDRIARELHDTVIQELFAIGLGLQGIQTRAESPEVGARIAKAVDDLDETIRAIRFTIYELHRPEGREVGARQRVVDLVSSLGRTLGFEPKVRFDGPVDAVVTADITEQLMPAIREALTNIARHAGASAAVVSLAVDDSITLEVTDNGRGIGEPVRRSGLANLAERAARLGGAFEVRARDAGGTLLRWSVPVADGATTDG